MSSFLQEVAKSAPPKARALPGSPANTSGLKPLGRAVLLLAQETDSRASLITLPDFVKQRQLVLDTEAIVVEIGANCWPDEPARCKVGDRVILAAMSGSMRAGKDGKAYRFVNDRDIYGLVEQEQSA